MILYLIELILLILVSSQYFNIITSEDDPYGQIQSMQNECNTSPITYLNKCSNKCYECILHDPNKCSECLSQFTINNLQCQLNNSVHSFSLHRYLNTGEVNKMTEQITQFVDVHNNRNLSSGKLLYNCRLDIFQMLMAGLFTAQDKIGIPYKLVNSIDEIQVKVNLMSIIQDIELFIDINDTSIHHQKFTVFSNLRGMYAIRYKEGTKIEDKAFLFLNALDIRTVNYIITMVDTGVHNIVVNDFVVSFSTQTANNDPNYKYYWGFSDVVIIQRKCETCVKEEVKKLISKVTQMGYIVGGILCFLVFVLFSMIYVEQLVRKGKTKVKMGLVDNKRSFTGANLPERAIKRMFEAITKTKISMQNRGIDFKTTQTVFLKHGKRE